MPSYPFPMNFSFKKVFRWFLNDSFILSLILLNVIVIFIAGFTFQPEQELIIELIDHLLTLLFIIEVIVKWKHYTVKGYFQNSWNIFDFSLVAIAIPSLILFFMPVSFVDLQYFLVLRVLRVFKFLRFFRFLPDVDRLAQGVWRALKSSIIILIAFAVFNIITAVLTSFIFRTVAPEFFGDPLLSLYNTFKIFTIEGWYEIPDAISENLDSDPLIFLTRSYFIAILISGGIFGLSLVNSIFVDAMLADNNDDLNNKLQKLEAKMDIIMSKLPDNK